MRILLDGRPVMGGVERYTRGLIRLLAGALPDGSLLVFGDRRGERREKGEGPGAFRSLLGDVKRVAGDQLLLPRVARRWGADVFHSTNHFAPRLLSIPAVVTCHDLWLLEHFETKKRGWMKYYERRALRSSLHRAEHVIAPSETVVRQVQERVGLPDEKVTAIYPPLPEFPPPSVPPSFEALIEKPYFLAVGTLEPRKNLERLLDAHERVYRQCGAPLYLVGAYGWKQEEVLRRVEASRGAVRWLGRVEDAFLAALYEKARAVVACSLDEGFDYPSVEALMFATPVILSDIPVHREVVGPLGLYAPATDAPGLAERMLEVLAWSGEQRERFKQRAQSRVEAIRTAGKVEGYLRVYERAR